MYDLIFTDVIYIYTSMRFFYRSEKVITTFHIADITQNAQFPP